MNVVTDTDIENAVAAVEAAAAMMAPLETERLRLVGERDSLTAKAIAAGAEHASRDARKQELMRRLGGVDDADVTVALHELADAMVRAKRSEADYLQAATFNDPAIATIQQRQAELARAVGDAQWHVKELRYRKVVEEATAMFEALPTALQRLMATMEAFAADYRAHFQRAPPDSWSEPFTQVARMLHLTAHRTLKQHAHLASRSWPPNACSLTAPLAAMAASPVERGAGQPKPAAEPFDS